MDQRNQWDQWLAEADSVQPLAPEGYDDDAAKVRVRTLWPWLADALATYEVRRGSSELYQDGTGLAGYRVTRKGDTGPFDRALAWILLSHFANLATVHNCLDSELLIKSRAALEKFGLRYIPHEYMSAKTYNGKCKALAGLSWANRYFGLVPDFTSPPEY